MATRKWYVLMFVASVALWTLVYVTGSIRDGSLYVISETAKVGAMIASFALVATAGLDLAGRSKRRGSSANLRAADPKAPDSFGSPQVGRDSERSNSQLSRADTIVGGVFLLALLGYFPTARYVQVLTPFVFWVVVVGLAAVGALLINLWSIRSGRPPVARDSIRIDRGLLPALLLVPCGAIALRLINTVPGCLFEPETYAGRVADTSVWGGQRSSWAWYSLEVQLDSGQMASFNVSRENFNTLPVGTKIKLQAWDGLLGMPWCLGDCIVPPPYIPNSP